MCKIVGIGANVYDTLIVLPSFVPENTKLRAISSSPAGGGPCATGLVAAAKLGASVQYIGNISDDDKGKFLMEDFARYGVETNCVTVKHGYNSFVSYVMLSNDTASRTIVFDKGNLPPLTLNGSQVNAVKNAQILMVDGNELEAAIDGAKVARENGVDVLYDAGGLYDGVERLMPYASIIIPSEEFSLAFTQSKTANEAAKKLYEKYKPKVVVITQGAKGGIMYDGSEIKPYPSMPIDVVDSNGAGDVFHGAFAFAMTNGYDYYKCCLFSSAVSALKCTKVGARRGVPTFDDTIKFLKECGINEFKEELE